MLSNSENTELIINVCVCIMSALFASITLQDDLLGGYSEVGYVPWLVWYFSCSSIFP